ncbi:outer membrane lipoprotein carrier protein LolA [Brevibacillus sp. NPDC003359]|uniref:LolA family protein n=1 Tax=unclassified Brevibacillus TaxID=2684853 RepID=UPI00368045FA
MKIYKWMVGGSLLASLLLSGCGDGQTFSSDDVVTKMMERNKAVGSYYAEGIMNEYSEEKKVNETSFAEWYDANTGKRRFELKTNNNVVRGVNDGKQVITYDEAQKTALSMEMPNQGVFGSGTPKEQLIAMLEKVKSSHQIEVIGEEKVNGFDTHHLKATTRDKSSLFGDMELWVDQKTWQVLKSSATTGESKMNVEYTKIELSPSFDDKTFVLDLPPDIKVTPIEDLNPAKKVTVEEAQAAMRAPFLYWEGTEFSLKGIDLNEWKGELNRNELTLNYMKGELPYFSLSVFPTPKANGSTEMGGEKAIKVRGLTGSYMEEIHCITWDEKGLRYTALILHPDLTLDEMLMLTEKMEWSDKR